MKKIIIIFSVFCGWMAERLNATVLKTVEGLRPPWVRISLHPPFNENILSHQILFFWSSSWKLDLRMDGRAVECNGLENRRGFTPSVSSNLTPSATSNHVFNFPLNFSFLNLLFCKFCFVVFVILPVYCYWCDLHQIYCEVI